MKIALFRNTDTPHVGGVANSVSSLVSGMRERGHDCLVVAPEFPGQPESERGVVRIPSIRNFNGTDFSFKLPSGTLIGDSVRGFKPDVIHSHHPFLLGDAAIRMAHQWDLPLVFTHHTRYENYVHYVLKESDWLRRLAIELANEYANLCDRVIAPSRSIAELIAQRGVETPVTVIPTGIDLELFRTGDRDEGRRLAGLAKENFVIGHVGRLAPEKNLPFLFEAVCSYLLKHPDARFLVLGVGECLAELKARLGDSGLTAQVRFLGKMTPGELVNLYRAMDVFVFASKSETQGMVLAESMAAGVPVVALDASGVRDIVRDHENGLLLAEDSGTDAFARAIGELRGLQQTDAAQLGRAMDLTAREFSRDLCLGRIESVYFELIEEDSSRPDLNGWSRFMKRLDAEWELALGRARALGASFND
jgi:glycosyltransferase involved in cell wall biosynthesis